MQLHSLNHAAMQVYVIGDVGIEEELKLKGINYMGGPSDADQKVELSAGYALPHDPDVSAPASVYSLYTVSP